MKLEQKLLALAIASSLGTTAFAEVGIPMPSIEEIVTVGTRTAGRTAIESPVPVDVISESAIINSGAVDTPDMLRKLAPSFNMNNTTTSDGQDLMRPATLRSLGPDQVLVLVNGKRRHQQALVAVQENVGRGSAGTDLSAIPLSAIARVEILRDGAAAQYGSDAIAGVINIILKNSEGGNAWGQYRVTDQNDGKGYKAGAHYGMAVGDGSLNLSFEAVKQDAMNRATPSNWFGDSPVTKQLILLGEAEVESSSAWFNFEMPMGGAEIYAFGGITQKQGDSLGFYRGPSDDRVWSQLYPEGITPGLGTETTDHSLAAGYKRELGEWEMDSSLAWGRNRMEFRNTASLNASYGPNGPTTAYDGALVFEQTTFNLDFVRSLELAFTDSASFASGFEWREDGYQMEAGDPVSYDRGDVLCSESVNPTGDPNAVCSPADYTVPGMQGFQGYRPDMEIDASRNNIALYADTELNFTDKFTTGLALRYEDFSDFGDTLNGKLSARYAFTDELALRAAASTGFRAPGMQQRYFTQRSISLSNGQLSDLVTLRPDSDLAQELGFKSLKEETSQSISLGLTYSGELWTSTLDAYQIDIDDRIVYSDNITSGNGIQAVDDFFTKYNQPGAELDGVVMVSVFTNAIDTRTRGVDWVNEWNFGLDSGDNLTLEATFHLNNTTITSLNAASSIVPSESVFGASQQLLLTDGQPKQRATLGATYDAESWQATLRANHYGEVSSASYGTPKNTWGAKTLFDLTGQWNPSEALTLSAGVLNLLDTKPDEWGAEGFPFTELGFKYGWTTFPFSLAGREYYLRASYNF